MLQQLTGQFKPRTRNAQCSTQILHQKKLVGKWIAEVVV